MAGRTVVVGVDLHAPRTASDEESSAMADIAFVAIALAFFGLAYLYVLGCDRIVGRDPAVVAGDEVAEVATVPDPAREVGSR
jgi:hypothetical protein